MTFVGMAIIKIFVMWTHAVSPCSPAASACTAVAMFVTEPQIEERVVYLGQFDKLEQCQRASSPNAYVLEPGENFVEPTMVQTLCATKDGTEWLDRHD